MENFYPELSAMCINCDGVFSSGELDVMSCCPTCANAVLDSTFGSMDQSFEPYNTNTGFESTQSFEPSYQNNDIDFTQPFKPVYAPLGDGMDSMQNSDEGCAQIQQILASRSSNQASPVNNDSTVQQQQVRRADSVVEATQDFTNVTIQQQEPELELPSSCMDIAELTGDNDMCADMLVNGKIPEDLGWNPSEDQDMTSSEDTGVQTIDNVAVTPVAAVAEETAASPLSSLFPESAFTSATTGAPPAPPAQEGWVDPMAYYHEVSSDEVAIDSAAGASAMPTTERTLEQVEADLYKTLSGAFGPQTDVAASASSPPAVVAASTPTVAYSSPPAMAHPSPPAVAYASPPTVAYASPPAQTNIQHTPTNIFAQAVITTPKSKAETLCIPFLNSQGTWCPQGDNCPYHHFAHVITPQGHITAPPGSVTVATKGGTIVLSAEYVEETQKAFERHRQEVKNRKPVKFECATCHLIKPQNPSNDGVRCTPCFKRKAAAEALGQIWEDKIPKRSKKSKAADGYGFH